MQSATMPSERRLWSMTARQMTGLVGDLARDVIATRRYRVRSRWADVQPGTAERNAYLKSHSWDEYSAWHLALTDGPGEQTKARYAFAFVDFSRLHRMGLIACYYRAAEWEHTE